MGRYPGAGPASRDEDRALVIRRKSAFQLVEDDIRREPPVSFPGKLLAFLYERYKAFDGSPESADGYRTDGADRSHNGKKLAGIVRELGVRGGVEEGFGHWLERHCRFCSSLVDRIVPGRPDAAALQQLEHDLGYTDRLLAVCEVYRLWAIEGDEGVRRVLSFWGADEGVIIEPDIEIYRELKLRMLNATHTLSCGLAVLAGFATVKNGMDDAAFGAFCFRSHDERDRPGHSLCACAGERGWRGNLG